jgi:hypothetical protein
LRLQRRRELPARELVVDVVLLGQALQGQSLRLGGQIGHDFGVSYVLIRCSGSKPYAALLAENTTDEAMAWVKAVQSLSAPNTRKSPREPSEPLPRAFSGGDLSIFFKMAELETRRSKTYLAWQRIGELHAKRFGR